LPVAVCVVLAVVVSGCDDDTGKSTRIGVLSPTAAFVNHAVSVAPAAVQSARIPGASCPQSPLVAGFSLVMTAGDFDLFVTSVDMQFVDLTGLRSPRTSMTVSDLANRFGSTRVAAQGTRTFPLEFPFGCPGAPPGTLTVVVTTNDTQQRGRRMSFDVPVR
jgi:hypothetical protein